MAKNVHKEIVFLFSKFVGEGEKGRRNGGTVRWH